MQEEGTIDAECVVREKDQTDDTPFIPTPDNPPWSSIAAIGIWFFSVLLLLIIPTIFVLIYVLISGMTVTAESAKDPTIQFIGLTAAIPAHLLTLAAAYLIVTQRGRFSLSQTLGLSMAGYKWWYFALILLGIVGIAVVVLHFFPEQENDLTRLLRSSRAAVYLLAALATISAPIVEEIVYRGLLYSAFQRNLGKIAAVCAVTLIFAGVHFFQYWGSPGTIIMIVCLSLILTVIRSTSKNLLPSIILHFLFNGVQSVLLILEPYITNNSSENPNMSGLIFWLLK